MDVKQIQSITALNCLEVARPDKYFLVMGHEDKINLSFSWLHKTNKQ